MHDEGKGKAAIKALPEDAKAHLSHVLRNGICKVLSEHRRKGDVESALKKLESDIGDLEL